MVFLKVAKAQLYLRKVASACRVIKYNRALQSMQKEAGGMQDWMNLGASAANKGLQTLSNGVKGLSKTVSNFATNTANNIANAASKVGEKTQDFLGGVNHSSSGQTTPYYNNAALRQPVRPQGPIPQAPTPVSATQYSPMTTQDQKDMGRINAMTSDYGSSRGAYIPNVPLARPEMNPSQARPAPDQSNYALTEEEPSPMMGQTVPYMPGITEPSVSQAAPAQDTSYFDSLSPEQQVNWVAYSHATNRRGTYPTSQQDLADANRYRQTYGLRPGIKKYYTTAQKVVENRRRNQANRQTNQQTSNQMVSNY